MNIRRLLHLSLAIGVGVSVLFSTGLRAFAASPSISEFNLAVDSSPYDITNGPDGNLWFTENDDGKIGKITPAGVITEYDLTSGSAPRGITTGSDGNLWFTEFESGKIGKITTSGSITKYDLAVNSQPNEIVAGPDGNIWFGEWGSGKIGKITTSGSITEYDAGEFATPADMTVGPDGNIWFTEYVDDQIGKITTDGTLTEYDVTPESDAIPYGITSGPDGNIWFGVDVDDLITKMTTNGTIIGEYALDHNAVPGGITVGPDGNLWFTENNLKKIDRITTNGNIVQYALSGDLLPGNIITGPDGNLWFTESDIFTDGTADKIGRLNLVPSNTSSGVTTTTVDSGLVLNSLNLNAVDNQVLVVDGTLGDVNVQSGGTLKGTGTVGDANIASGGTLAPGHSPGCLNATNLTLAGTYQAEIGGTTACTEYDQTIVSGTVDVTNGTLTPTLYNGFVPKVGQSYTIINNTGSNPVTGTFTGIAQGGTVTNTGVTYSVSYIGGDGNDVVITVTAVDASKLPSSPNTGTKIITANPLLTISLTTTIAAGLFLASRRLKALATK